MTETQQLLRDYVTNDSEAAFREIVERYINLVYFAALRVVEQNPSAAEDVVQTVFTDLARKAGSLPDTVQLGGWLYRHACFTASTLMRGERRRVARERQAVEMNSLETAADWNQLEPVLDVAMGELPEDDRQLIVLRFFEQRDMRAVGAVFGISDNAAQKRVNRALDKLRDLIAQRGAALSAAALATLLTSEAVRAAPTGLSATVTGTALTSAKAAAGFLGKSLPVKVALAIAALVMICFIPSDVAAGRYEAELDVYKMDSANKPEKRLQAKASVTVPETPATGTIDLGALEVKALAIPAAHP